MKSNPNNLTYARIQSSYTKPNFDWINEEWKKLKLRSRNEFLNRLVEQARLDK